jgi:hypothetical protein
MSAPKSHALFAASSSDRWMNCPSSLKSIEKAPEQKSGAAADYGTLAHSLMELALETGEEDVIGTYDPDVYPDEMREHIQDFVDFVRSLVKEHDELLIEEKVYLDFLHPTEAFGTVDVAIIEPFGCLHIIDLKYGEGYVNHKDNSQMIYYALGLAHKHKYDFDEIKVTIYQPRGGGEVARTDSFSVSKLKSWKKEFEKAVARCESATDTSDLNAGSWCKFCPAKVICPALTKASFDMAKLDFASEVQPDPKALTSNQLKTILDRSAYLELWIKEVKKYAEARLSKGEKISGWGLVPTRAQRVWKDAKKVAAKFPDLESPDIMSVAQAEKFLKTRMTKEVLARFINENVVAVSSGNKLNQTTNDFGDLGLDDLIAD